MKKAIPILSSLQVEGLNEDEFSIALNKFDFYYFKQKCDYFSINIENYYNFIDSFINSIDQVYVDITINGKKYTIDITRLYIDSIYTSKELLFKKFLEQYEIEFTEGKLKSYHPKGGYVILLSQLKKLYVNAVEFLFSSSIGKEDHATIDNIERGEKGHNINNTLYSRLIQGRVNRSVKKIMRDLPLWICTSEVKSRLKQLISELNYLEKKSFENIFLSNFTGVNQYACILYSQKNGKTLEIYQHGNYLVHGIPCPYKLKYLPESIHLYEQEFIDKTGVNHKIDQNYCFNRLGLNKVSIKEDYILIATSPPMDFDIDKYYDLWSYVATHLVKEEKRKIKTKLHAKDNITPNIIKHFGLTHEIEIINNINTIPTKAITLNSSIYHELKIITNTISFGT